jgi:hypothetical protein
MSVHDDDNEDQKVLANQIMGINMTKAVQRDGVNILQLQNIKAIGKVTNHAVRALQELDALEIGYREEVQTPLLLPEPEDNDNHSPIERVMEVCDMLMDDGFNMSDMTKIIRYCAAKAAVRKHQQADKAAKALSVTVNYIHALKRKPKFLSDEDWIE